MADELEFSLDSYVSRSTPIVIGSLSSADTAEYTSTTEFIAKAAERKGSYDVSAADTDKYTDDAPTSFANIAYCVISDDSIVMSNGKGTMTISKGSFVKGKPVLHFQPVASLPGVVVSNLGATSSDSQVGMASKKFDHVWANNLNNNAVTDSSNQTLSVPGATSIIGALNQINSRLCNLIVVPLWQSPNYPDSTDWLKLWIKHVVSLLDNTEPTIVIGTAWPNSIRLVFAYFYDTKDYRDGMPRYAFGSYTTFDGTPIKVFAVDEGYFKGEQI